MTRFLHSFILTLCQFVIARGEFVLKVKAVWGFFFNPLAHASTFIEVKCACAVHSMGMKIWYLFIYQKYCGCHVTTQSKYKMYVGTS